MASIVFPDLPIEAFYYNGQSEDMFLEEWTIPKIKNLNLAETAQVANLSVVWPPILSSDCSTWLAIRKVKSGKKEKLEESQNPWLASATPSVSGSTNYVDAVREGLKKSMMTYNYLNEVAEENKKSFVSDIAFINPGATSKAKADKKERIDGSLEQWLVPAAFSASDETEYLAIDKEGLEKPRKASSSYHHEAITENNVAFTNPDRSHSIASPYFDNENSIWLNMRDTGKTEGIITEAMSNMTMDMEDVPNEHCLVWLSANSRYMYAFDGVESEASIEVIDSHDEDFENIDEI